MGELDAAADAEHEEDEPDLREYREEGLHIGGKQRLRRVAREQTEHAGPEGQARHDLAHDGRLPQPLGRTAAQEGRQDDDGEPAQDRAHH